MNPVRVTPPTERLVDLQDMRAYLRVDGTHEDPLIEYLQDAAVAHLDGWRGILGRCILPQEWQVSYDRAGCHRLPFPDVTEISAVDAEGDPAVAALSHDAIGSLVTIDRPATVRLVAALPEDVLPVVAQAVKLLVGHWYKHREAVGAGGMAEMPITVQALIGPLRVVRF